MRAVPGIHFAVRPTAAFAFRAVYAGLPLIHRTRRGHVLNVHLHLFAWVSGALVWLVLPLPRRFCWRQCAPRRPFETAVAARIALRLCLLIRLDQVASVFLAHLLNQSDFRFALCLRKRMWTAAVIRKALGRSIPTFPVLPDDLSAYVEAICRLYPRDLQIFHHPLTKRQLLCYTARRREPPFVLDSLATLF